ncbi:MAG TPA: hypothetical protein VJ725_32915, partial [Thermoanaerobaculia bacterium]|nr:hypothetical protein [Thermoanaerobaculia bacterium]
RPVRSGPPRLATAAVVSALVAAAALLAWPLRPPAQEETLEIQNVGDVLIVRSPEGGGWLLRSGETERGSSSSILIVTHGGEK